MLDPSDSALEHVAVAIATYKRPEGLRKLLDSLASLEWPGELTVIVADNDSTLREGLDVCEALAPGYRWPMLTTVVPEPGIPFPRNAACELAFSVGADGLAFIDDDEWTDAGWLRELTSVLTPDTDLVGGPQSPVFPDGTSALLRSNPYYGHDRPLQSGQECVLQSSGNFLIRASALKPHGPPWFDPAYARTSGADHDLFVRLAMAGARMRWAPLANVYEDVPQDRLTEEWIRERVTEIHNGRVRIDRRLQPSWHARFIRGAKTAALAGKVVALSLVGVVSPAIAYRAKLEKWKLVGKVAAHRGLTVERKENR